MKQNIQTELEAQRQAIFLWKAGNMAALLLWLIIGYCGSPVFMIVAMVAQGLYWLAKWGPMRDEMQSRQTIVLLKQQTDNLYVFSEHPTDETVAAYFEKTLQLLRQSGNEHGVKVHMAIFGDVKVFTSWWDAKGIRQDETRWREAGSSYESWGTYRNWCEDFKMKDRDERFRELRKGSAGAKWVHENIFGQNVTDN